MRHYFVYPGLAILGLVLTAASPRSAAAQEKDVTLDDLFQSAQEWANENLDDDILRALPEVDQNKVRQFLKDLEQQLRGGHVLDLALVEDAAKSMVPILESYEETVPYAVWLKARLDYLEVAEQLRATSPKPKPGTPPTQIPNPTPQVEREIWVKKLADRPLPSKAQPLAARLRPIFTAQNVPPQLIWIAEVESSFDPRARSPQGAAGLFQLMPATAKRFGLRVRPFDQRLNAEDSTNAAAKYLRYLHGHFNDWSLALAAYNAGEGTVDKLLKRYKTRSFDAIATHLPAETQMYVPKVEAVLLRREGIKLKQL